MRAAAATTKAAARTKIEGVGERVTRMKGKHSTRRQVETRQAVTRRTLLVNAFVLARNKHRKDSRQTPQDTPPPSTRLRLLLAASSGCCLYFAFDCVLREARKKFVNKNFRHKLQKEREQVYAGRGGGTEREPSLCTDTERVYDSFFLVLWRLF